MVSKHVFIITTKDDLTRLVVDSESTLEIVNEFYSLKGTLLATLWKRPKKYWRPFLQHLQSSGDTLGNAQIKMENRWVHFPTGLQPLGNLLPVA